MEQIRFTITPYYNGWRVDDGLRDRDWFGQLEDAVASADTLARTRHALDRRGHGGGGRGRCRRAQTVEPAWLRYPHGACFPYGNFTLA